MGHGLYQLWVEAVKARFDEVDEDLSGELSQQEFRELALGLVGAGVPLTQQQLQRFHQEADNVSHDGLVSFEELIVWLVRKFPECTNHTPSHLQRFFHCGVATKGS